MSSLFCYHSFRFHPCELKHSICQTSSDCITHQGLIALHAQNCNDKSHQVITHASKRAGQCDRLGVRIYTVPAKSLDSPLK